MGIQISGTFGQQDLFGQQDIHIRTTGQKVKKVNEIDNSLTAY